MHSKSLNVIIFGCGNIGIRHIQGLSKSAHLIKVFAYNPNRHAIFEFKKLYESLSNTASNLKITWFHDLERLLTERTQFDLAIISSTAYERTSTLEKCFENFESKYWVLEKPLTQSSKALKKMHDICGDKKVWVNHPMRSTEWFKRIKSVLQKEGPLTITVAGPDIGIACNCSHYVDLVNFFTGELPVQIDISNLIANWHASKRKGFFETDGELMVTFDNGTRLSVISNDHEKSLLIEGKKVKTGDRFFIDEEAGIAHLPGGVTITGRKDFQSELTGKYIDQLVLRGDCDLPTLELAIRCYSPIIKALTRHWQLVYPNDIRDSIPIT